MAIRLVRKKIYPNVHVNELKFQLSANNTGENATNIPIIMQDEGKGDPNSKYTNPESASFSESNEPNCYPDSRVNYAQCNLELQLTKGAIETDKVQVMKVAVIPWYTSFLENLTSTNEVTSEEVEDILELQHETTDRQTYPLWSGTKLNGDFLETGANVPGLTTNTNIESIDFDMNKLYDSLQFYTNGGKIRKSIGKIKWLYVARDRILRLKIRSKSKVKAMNPYTAMGVIIYLPKENEVNSLQLNTDLTGINHMTIKATYRYNEWNENFNAMR